MITAADSASAAIAPAAAAKSNPASIAKAATDFEAVFATQMLTHMYEGMEVNPITGGGHGEEMFRTMLLDQYGKQMAKNDTLGIVKEVSAQMLRIQEGRHGNN